MNRILPTYPSRASFNFRSHMMICLLQFEPEHDIENIGDIEDIEDIKDSKDIKDIKDITVGGVRVHGSSTTFAELLGFWLHLRSLAIH